MKTLIVLSTLLVCLGAAAEDLNETPFQDAGKAVLEAESGNYETARQGFLRQVNMFLAKGQMAAAGEAYVRLGDIAQVHGAFLAAELTYRKGIDLLVHNTPPEDLRASFAMDDLGWMYVTWGRLPDGSRLMDQARARAEHVLPNDAGLIRHLDVQAAYNVVIGRYSEAYKNWNRALAIGSINFGPDSPKYANLLVHIAQASSTSGDYRTAEEMLRRYLAAEEAGVSTTPMGVAIAQGELGHVCTGLHKFSEAQSWLDQSLSVFRKYPDAAPLVQSMILTYMGDLSMAQSDWAGAGTHYRDALRLQQSVLGENNAVAASMLSLSSALKKLHRNDEAKQFIVRANAIRAARKNPVEEDTVDVLALRRQ